MLPAPWFLALALLLDGRAPRNAVEVIASGGRVTVRAERLPLYQLLDRMAVATGMELTYDGARPSALVSVDVEDLSEVAATLKVMEGLGISYVLRTDATGEGVDRLIVAGPDAGSLVAAVTPSAHVDPPYEPPIEAFNRVPLDPAVVEASGGAGPPDLNNRYMGLPPQIFPQGAAAAKEGAGLAEEEPAPPAPAPRFPQGASYPSR